MGLKNVNHYVHLGSISRAYSWNSDKRTGHEWILGFPANFSLQYSWLTLHYRFVFLNVCVWSNGSCIASEHGHTTQWLKYFALHKYNPYMIIFTIS